MSNFSILATFGIDGGSAKKGLDGLGDAFGKFGKAAVAAVGAAMIACAAAVAKFAQESITKFVAFEKGMFEVFTLLPGMSEEAMGDMEEDVKKLAKELGILPEKIIPALYQAISAGVPKENVFDFLRTAGKAAIGGVTDIETAVDGLSSVVNSYGADVLSVERASHLMFSGVKLGKTTFEELSGALFQVVPIAKAMGIGFDQVTAALTTMTSQGIPTSVATTQLRSAIQALAAPSEGAIKTMSALGININDLEETMTSEPGGLVKAMSMVVNAADGNKMALREMFGSVEALNAVLVLTDKGAGKFNETLTEMNASVGADQVAFEKMEKSTDQVLNKLKASWEVAMLDVGKALAPVLLELLPHLQALIQEIVKLPWAETAKWLVSFLRNDVIPGLKALFKILKTLYIFGKSFFDLIIASLLTLFYACKSTFDGIWGLTKTLGSLIFALLNSVWQLVYATLDVIATVLKAIVNTISESLKIVWEIIKGLGLQIWGWMKKIAAWLWLPVKILSDVLTSLGEALTDFAKWVLGLGERILSGILKIFKSITDTFMSLVKVITNPLSMENWKALGKNIIGIFGSLYDGAVAIVKSIFGVFGKLFDKIGTLWNKLKKKVGLSVKETNDTVKAANAENVKNYKETTAAITQSIDAVGENWDDTASDIKKTVGDAAGSAGDSWKDFGKTAKSSLADVSKSMTSSMTAIGAEFKGFNDGVVDGAKEISKTWADVPKAAAAANLAAVGQISEAQKEQTKGQEKVNTEIAKSTPLLMETLVKMGNSVELQRSLVGLTQEQTSALLKTVAQLVAVKKGMVDVNDLANSIKVAIGDQAEKHKDIAPILATLLSSGKEQAVAAAAVTTTTQKTTDVSKTLTSLSEEQLVALEKQKNLQGILGSMSKEQKHQIMLQAAARVNINDRTVTQGILERALIEAGEKKTSQERVNLDILGKAAKQVGKHTDLIKTQKQAYMAIGAEILTAHDILVLAGGVQKDMNTTASNFKLTPEFVKMLETTKKTADKAVLIKGVCADLNFQNKLGKTPVQQVVPAQTAMKAVTATAKKASLTNPKGVPLNAQVIAANKEAQALNATLNAGPLGKGFPVNVNADLSSINGLVLSLVDGMRIQIQQTTVIHQDLVTINQTLKGKFVNQ